MKNLTNASLNKTKIDNLGQNHLSSQKLKNGKITSSAIPNNKEMNLGNLTAGKTFTGQITDIRNGFVTIAVGEQFVHAKFDKSVNVCMGEVMSFIVRENSNNQVTIAPYRGNSITGEDVVLYKALEAAGLPATDKNIDVISELFHNQMSVDKKMIQSILAKTMQFPNANIEDLVVLFKYKIPVTEGNLEQLARYHNHQHQLMGDITKLAESFPNTLKQLIEEQGKNAALKFFHQVIEKETPETLKELENLLFSKESNADLLHELLSEPEIKNAFTKHLQNKLSLEPKELTKEVLNETYDKIEKQLEGLKEIMGKIPQEQVSQAKNNLEFIKQVNETFIYTQLPLKMKNQMTNGELYVYTNKKKSHSAQEGFRLFLHLNMEYLGDLNVMIQLYKNNLNLNFSMSNAEAEQLIKDKMDELTDCLTNKGFQVSAFVEQREEKVDFVEDFMKQEEKKTEYKRFSFDIRA